MIIKCECGTTIERPNRYKDLTDIVIVRWKLKYCDECLNKRINKVFKKLPDIIETLANDT